MGNIAGIKSKSSVHGRYIEGNINDTTIVPLQEVYSLKDVYTILRKYDWYSRGYAVAEDRGASEEEALSFAEYLSNKLENDEEHWEGIDKFMNMGEDNE